MRRKKMKKRHFLGFLALVVSVGFFIGCSTGSSSAAIPAYVGTWSGLDAFGSGTGTLTLTITATTMHFAIAGGSMGVGAADMTLVVDESLKHITATATAVTGGLTSIFTVSSTFYTTYDVTGTTLKMAAGVSALPFPPDATGGFTLTKV
jgi:hypothetical protein